MKKNVINLLSVIFAAVLALSSCATDEKKAKSLVADLATAIANKDKGTIEKIYPDAAKATELALQFSEDSIEVTPSEKEDEFNVTVGKNVRLVVVKDSESGNLTVKESYGVFTWPAERMSFAKSTGWYDEKLTDKENAERLSDESFVDYLGGSLLSEIQRKVYAKAVYDIHAAVHGASYEIEVRNDNDFDLPGDAYVATATLWGFDFDRLESVPTRTKKEFSGNTVPAHGTARYNIPGTVDFEYESWEADIRITMSKEQAVTKFLSPKGTEYEEYLKIKESGSALQLNLRGSIGGANDAVFNLNGTTGEGETSFTVAGTRNDRKLKLGSFDEQSGKLVIEEYFTNGKYIGDFVGTYKNGVYKGVFTNKQSGGKVDFNLK